MEIQIDVREILTSCNKYEKRELWEILSEEQGILTERERNIKEVEEKRIQNSILTQTLESMSSYELKILLCDVLNIPNHYDEQGLRAALETIIKA